MVSYMSTGLVVRVNACLLAGYRCRIELSNGGPFFELSVVGPELSDNKYESMRKVPL